ncbi:Maf family nucleotide pyrophosphatase [Flavobacteriaceae bacterium]|jgi:septum formation protein|nr:Maf family nucleotide pyrophosphatase [Flavobacteriaceae bacterium]
MLKEQLTGYTIILASSSPRRQELLRSLNVDFEVRLKPVKEIFSKHLCHHEISDFLAILKSKPFIRNLNSKDILITSDTIVWHNNKALGKPKTQQEAINMLQSLSHQTHEVITSVCFTTSTEQKTINSITKVKFKALSDDEIWYYVTKYNPMDKAGAYGIQDWIGQIGIEKIEGSYFNVMGLPINLVYKNLLDITSLKKT